ncbi:MAG: hypothetical protein KBG47_12845 [Bacteroidia bacterium]|nr:hypothetical protein [Bacteroidia bacterium]
MHKLFSILFILASLGSLQAQDSSVVRNDLPNLFMDCEFCAPQFFKQEITFVNFVRDRRLADIYMLGTANFNAGGAAVLTLYFVGENKFKGQNDTLVYKTVPNMADAEAREGLLNTAKQGLLKYIVKTDLLKKINYTIDVGEQEQNGKVKDKWNYWVFNINANVDGNANSYQSEFSLNGNLNANRTTEKLRVETGGWYSLNKQKFVIDDSTTVTGLQSNLGSFHLMAFTLGKHWAVGHFATYFQSTQNNLRNSYSYYPGIEYNVFSYAEAGRRQLRFIYRLGARYQDYFETTVYDKKSELYGLHSFVVQWNQIEKWGNLYLTAGGWHYFNYPNNYSASIYPSINFNPLKGLRLGLWCGFSIVNDQFFLRKSEATANEILLEQVKLKTAYNYNYGFNINYTFGSKYNNIVNVRFNLDDNYW